VTGSWICLECGARQPESGPCRACGKDDTLDGRSVEVRELMRDVETRLHHQRDTRFRFIGAGAGIVAIIALWFVPHYWEFRESMALPFYFDQWILMALIGFGLNRLLLARFSKPRFPYFDANALELRE